MSAPYRILTTPGFDRDAKKTIGRNQKLTKVLAELLEILSEDPQNHTAKYQIKKLAGLRPGEGQWRIRSGNYRLRYDVFGTDVLLYSFRDRKEAYRT